MSEDVWVPTVCSMCYNSCGIKVHRVDGVVVKIEGNPDSPAGLGRLCPKGLSGIMTLYDPHRVRTPLKRTNPQKGIGIDPQWVEIGWEEALETISGKLRTIREEDPRKLMLAGSVANIGPMNLLFSLAPAFGTPNFYVSGAGIHCGNGEHLFSCLLHASWNKIPDYDHCNYLLLFGCHIGFAAYYSFTTLAQRCSDARARGMRVVVVDPMMNAAAEKADEWVPIRPGTDAAMGLGMIHVLLNELSLFDAEHLREHTNAPYLIGPDGYYLREGGNGKPLVWDASRREAVPFDAAPAHDLAIEGTVRVDGVEARPAFSLLRDHVKRYTPEEASKITTVPAAIIRRLAQEFGEAARIGSTMTIEGKKLPYRPAAAVYFKGAQGHKHSLLTCMSLDLLNMMVGACDVPGGILGTNATCLGHPETGRPAYAPKADADGLMITGTWVVPTVPYPPAEVTRPESLTLAELLPLSIASFMPILTIPDPARWGIPYEAGALINLGSNLLMGLGDPETVAEALKRIPFIVSFALNLDESTDFSDVVLPDACYLERLDPYPTNFLIFNFPGGRGEWAWQLRQPAVAPQGEARHSSEVLLELAKRAGFLPDLFVVLNLMAGLEPPYQLDPEASYSWDEIVDRWCKSYFGPERGLEWFKRNNPIRWPKKVEEVYWRSFSSVRVPLYFEYFPRVGEQVRRVTEELGVAWDVSDYQPLPDWRPCPSHQVRDPDYDLYAFYYRVAWHTFSWTMENPWLNEVSEMDPWGYYVVLNAEVARKKGIRDGDSIWVESIKGRRVQGRAKLSQAIHPEALGVAGNGGHWAPGLPIARNKGMRVCALQPVDLEYTDLPTNNLDLCVKVKVSRA